MARLTLKKLHMRNFKGVKDRLIEFSDGVTRISGANGTGKTTIVDAFCWVLWNKDSNDNAAGTDAFHEKPLDADGREVHYLTTEVELDCTLDGKPFVLKRTQEENWEKKRGFVDEVYKGNVSTYWINGIETKSADFKARIAEIVPADAFKLIGRLGAFNSIKWQERRATLVALSDGNNDEALLAQPGYKALASALTETGYTVDELRANLTDRRKRINDVLKMIPIRIDEVKKSIVQMTPEQIDDANYLVNDTQSDIDTITNQIRELQDNEGVASKRIQIKTLESQVAVIKRKMQSDFDIEHAEAQRTANAERETFDRLKQYCKAYESKLAQLNMSIADAVAERDNLRKQFAEIKAMPTDPIGVCPTCKRLLEPEEIEAARERLIENKKGMIADIRAMGKKAAERVDKLTAEKASFESELQESRAKLKAQEDRTADAYEKMVQLPIAPDFAGNKELTTLLAEIDALNTDDTADVSEKIAGLNNRLKELRERQADALAKVAECKATETKLARVAELEAQRKTEGANLATAEKLLDLTEQFIRDRCASLEESINKRFDNVRWKLFNVQINGGLADCCVCMIPCESGLVSYECANTAAQVNADIEIVRNLSAYYGVQLPLFIDNAERVNKLSSANTQMIELAVSEDKTLFIKEG